MTSRRFFLFTAALFLVTVTMVGRACAANAATAATGWPRLADCESGLRRHGRIVPGSARWHIHDRYHQGGLQFAISTWDAYRPSGYPVDAHLATPAQQIAVAVRVRDGVPGTRNPYLNAQGWQAWPTCSRALGLR